ncbi:MAG: dTDP-4-dehydrorhamnose 3,5-epimerase [Pseudomonadota bacterium]
MAYAQITRFEIDGPVLLEPRRHGDHRGWFSETWTAKTWREAGLPPVTWVQDNEAFSAKVGTLRGLHFQAPPHAQAKLVRCLSGAIFDVAVDLRNGSPTYGASIEAHLTAERGEQLFIPTGFSHGYQTLTPDCRVAYKVDAPYAPSAEGGLKWDDAALAIEWPLLGGAILSERDKVWPGLAELKSPFNAS